MFSTMTRVDNGAFFSPLGIAYFDLICEKYMLLVTTRSE